jgi:hypothetical protein
MAIRLLCHGICGMNGDDLVLALYYASFRLQIAKAPCRRWQGAATNFRYVLCLLDKYGINNSGVENGLLKKLGEFS